jgi:hypothetical protein
MSLYFSVGVWSSIALIHSPLPERQPLPLPRRSALLPWLQLAKAVAENRGPVRRRD